MTAPTRHRAPPSAPHRAEGLAALVLAAGASSRMGRPKALLELGGETLLARAVGTFAGAGVREVVVVLGHGAEALLPRALALGARCAVNHAWEQGMYSSLTAGLRTLGPGVGGCFVLPVDAAAIRSRTAVALARALRRAGSEIAYPTFGGLRGHPPLVSARLFPELLAGDGAGGLRALLSRHEGRAVDVPVLDEAVALDLDTPADHAAARVAFADRSVPTPAEGRALLTLAGAPARLVRHGERVAAVAGWLARAARGAGMLVDPLLAEAAGLLHDLCKGEPDHAREGALRLARLGFPRVARAVAGHTDLPEGSRRRLDETTLVYLADKLVRRDELVALADRFRDARARCPTPAASAALERRWADAEAAAAQVSALLGDGWPRRLAADLGPGAGAPAAQEEGAHAP